MIIKEISEDQLIEHLSKFENHVYTQSPKFVHIKKKLGVKVHRLGIFSGDKLIGSAIVFLKKNNFGFYVAKCLFGPMISSDDPHEYSIACKALGEYYKKQKRVLRLEMNPYVLKRKYDDIRPLEYSDFALNLDMELKSAGFAKETSEFYNKSGVQVRFQYVKKVNESPCENNFKKINSEAQKSILNAFKFNIKIRDAKTAEDFDICKDILENTYNNNLNNQPYPEFINYMRCSYDDDYRLKMAYIECDKSIKSLNRLLKPNRTPRSNRALKGFKASSYAYYKVSSLKDLISESRTFISFLEDLKEKKGNCIYLAAGLFVFGGNEMLCRFYGGYDLFENLESLYLIFWNQLLECCKLGIERFNLFALTGVFDEYAPDIKLLNFKRSFSGNVEELIGTYYYKTSLFQGNL